MTDLKFSHIPFPIGSIVRFIKRDKEDNRSFLVDAFNEIDIYESFPLPEGSPVTEYGVAYHVLGHENLNSYGEGSAWHEHEELSLVETPSIESWTMLAEARSHNEAVDDEEIENDI